MSTATETGSLIPSLDASNLSYQFERVRINRPDVNKIGDLLDDVDDKKAIPANLTYVSDFYDPNTGTSGTAFKDKGTGKVVIAFTGTNPNGEGLKGKMEFGHDIATDIFGIGAGLGEHYGPAYKFYETISKKYGATNVVLTGHSLGGNIAQRVALKYNAKETVVYNSAPLYIPVTSAAGGFFADTNISSIKKDKSHFTGQVTRITTAKDPLNKYSDMVGGVYLGEEYVIEKSGGHGLDEIVNDRAQVAQVASLLKDSRTTETVLKSVRSSMQKVATKKASFKADGCLSGAEKIYLDAVQSKAVAQGMTKVAQSGLSLVKSKEKEANQKAEELYHELDDVPWCFILSPAEMKQAYNDAGLNHRSIVGHISEHCSKKRKKVSDIVDKFTALQADIEKGIENEVQKDSELSQMFGLS